MKTIEKNCKKEQLEMAFICGLQKRLDTPLTFDSTAKTKRLLSLRKEFYSKYAECDDGACRFYFTTDLLEDLRRRAVRMDRPDDFCVILFCSNSELPCALTISELVEISDWCGKADYFNFSVEIYQRTFRIIAYSCGGERFEMAVSKKISSKKLCH